MPIKLSQFISRLPKETEAQVRDVHHQLGRKLRDALDNECRLSRADVSIKIEPGFPRALRGLEFAEEFGLILLLARYRTALEQVRKGAGGTLGLWSDLRNYPDLEDTINGSQEEVTKVSEWARHLLGLLEKNNPVRIIFDFDDDILGTYECKSERTDGKPQGTVRLYWGAIGVAAELIGCSVEALTTVALAHELAHAYTQLGADADGHRWPVRAFNESETSLKEGLAQYYTDRVLRGGGRQLIGALEAFERLLPDMRDAYRTHLPWVDNYSPEAVRRAMIEVRRFGESETRQFESRLEAAQKDLGAK